MRAKAKESSQIQKARKKIKDHLKKTEKRINPEALQTMSRLIKEQLKRQNPSRVNLKNRQITSFDENQHSVTSESKFIAKLLHRIKQGNISHQNDLEGRIKPISENHP